MTTSEAGLAPDIIEAFARGLYFVAACDGIEPREEDLLRNLLRETEANVAYEDLPRPDFGPGDIANALETSFLRRVFIRAAVAMVKADGKFTDGERIALGEIADAFGMSNREFGELEQEAATVHI
ncbi:MAG: TerB family tellurite resistance protein [Deltaproteobacteria bacterium]|nr:TerB family tellurite resistance protein [Nannocystaceae bacterium]